MVGTVTIAAYCSRHQLQRHDPQQATPLRKADRSFCQNSSEAATPTENVSWPRLNSERLAAEGRPRKTTQIPRKHQQPTTIIQTLCWWQKHEDSLFWGDEWMDKDTDLQWHQILLMVYVECWIQWASACNIHHFIIQYVLTIRAGYMFAAYQRYGDGAWSTWSTNQQAGPVCLLASP